MASSSSTATPAKLSFETRVGRVRPLKRRVKRVLNAPDHRDCWLTIDSEINALILDYLTMEGYSQAAANFSKEANLKPQQEESFVSIRQQVQRAIHSGQIEEAIGLLSHMNPEILDQDPTLYFALLRLQLVELIRRTNGVSSDFSAVIKFARDQLAPRAPMKKEFLKDLEETMVMLFFAPDKQPDPQKKLLSPKLREDVASQVNKAMLYHHSKRREAAIRHVVKTRAWAENVARDSKNDLPGVINLGLNPTANNVAHDHDNEAMITT